MSKGTVVLIDGLNNFLRSFHVVPTLSLQGDHVGGAVGFLRIVASALDRFGAVDCYVCWDGEGGSRWRRGIYADYKAGRRPKLNRTVDEDAEESLRSMIEQLAMVRRHLEVLGVKQIEISGMEADDVIAELCRHMGEVDKIIVSSDKDYLQLVDERTKVYSPTKRILYDEGKVSSEFGVVPKNFPLLRALAGDRSDNIKGVKGIGFSTAPRMFPFLVERESSLSEVIDHAGKQKGKRFSAILESEETMRRDMDLVQLLKPHGADVGVIVRERMKEEASTDAEGARRLFINDNLPYHEVDGALRSFRLFDGRRMEAKRSDNG